MSRLVKRRTLAKEVADKMTQFAEKMYAPKEENKELQMAKHNLERFLNQQEEEQKEKEKQHNKSGQSL